MTMRRIIGPLLINTALAALGLFVLLPMLWMLAVSFMQPGEAASYPPPLVPSHPTLANYTALFARGGMSRYLVNSFLFATAATALSLTFNVAAGYAFAKLHFPGRDMLFRLLLAGLVVPAQVGMLALFLMLKQMGLVNSYAGALVPWLASIFGIFIVRQYALSVPGELIEAGRLDGASELRIFWSIVLPMLRPVLVTLGLFTFVANWNDFLWPLIILSDDGRYTLPVALAAMSREHVQDAELMMAGAVVTIAPVLILFIIAQRQYVAGLTAGGVKG